jgi:hypothetical protein
MSQRHSRRSSRSVESNPAEHTEGRAQHSWSQVRSASRHQSRGDRNRPVYSLLSKLIEENAPLGNRSQLVLMYGPFQAEMPPEGTQGVASWLRDCIVKHGVPSLVRFDDRRRAQVFRRDQFQPWFETLGGDVMKRLTEG